MTLGEKEKSVTVVGTRTKCSVLASSVSTDRGRQSRVGSTQDGKGEDVKRVCDKRRYVGQSFWCTLGHWELKGQGSLKANENPSWGLRKWTGWSGPAGDIGEEKREGGGKSLRVGKGSYTLRRTDVWTETEGKSEVYSPVCSEGLRERSPEVWCAPESQRTGVSNTV